MPAGTTDLADFDSFILEREGSRLLEVSVRTLVRFDIALSNNLLRITSHDAVITNILLDVTEYEIAMAG
ncbi:hypothetical protein TWF751_010100 [Orbilia oligospora]|nr:hypothetical protein TWF751_010100 [Orbilia oligospora]